MHRLEAVPGIRQRAGMDDRERVLQVGVLDLGDQRIVEDPGPRLVKGGKVDFGLGLRLRAIVRAPR